MLRAMSRLSPVTRPFRRLASTSFGAAMMGGLVVAIVGLIAIAAGWVKSSDDGSQGSTLAAAPLPQSAPRQASADGLTVNQIYQKDSPGVVFIRSQSAASPPSPLDPFGGAAGPRPGRVS